MSDVPSAIETKFHRTLKGGWLASVQWKTADGVRRCTVVDIPDPMFFDALETLGRLLRSDACGRRNNVDELLPESLR